LMQFAHPLIAAGVFEHSHFRASPRVAVSRLHHTIRAMLALTFGDASERDETLDGIRAIHRRVNGHLDVATGPFPGGTRYSAEDPELVLWVHVTLLDSIPLIYELLIRPLTSAERDVYCEEAASVASALGARDDEIPRTWAAVRAYCDRMYASGTLHVGDTARELAHALIAPQFATVVAPAAWINRVITTALLPPHIRVQYGLSWTRGDERAYRAIVPTLRGMRRVLPDALALWPEARE
jgi:uncharacterized protein (DUF2236 family)